jgi:mannosyltransferase OCH1-like enzyme
MQNATIPKIIHQIWIGKKFRRPEKWMDTWAAMNPSFEHRIWTDETLHELLPLRAQRAFDTMPHLAGKADILRYEILHRYGGIYVDADMECISPFTDDLLQNVAFAAHENEYVRPGLIANSVIGTRPGCPMMDAMIEHVAALPNLAACTALDIWKVTGPLAFTRLIGQRQFTFVRLYPSFWFYPQHCSAVNYSGVIDRCYSTQFWGGTTPGVYEPL